MQFNQLLFSDCRYVATKAIKKEIADPEAPLLAVGLEIRPF